MHTLSRFIITLGFIGLAACSGITHRHVAEVVPTTRLTLIPQGPVVLVKLNGINSRALITNEDLQAPIQLLAIDPTLSDFQLITPQQSSITGVYSFPYTAKPSGYRVWADVKPTVSVSKTGAEEFPQADLGTHKIGAVNKTQTLTATAASQHFTLSFDHPPEADSESTGTIRIVDKEGKASPVAGEVFGFYDDFHSVFRLSLDKDGAFHLNPKKPAFIKLFARIKQGEKTVTAAFGLVVNKASD